jgi:pimeloyl-ACP methyl ester carboxylesterase
MLASLRDPLLQLSWNEDNNNNNKLIDRLIFYDQLGCGEKSAKPNDESCYSMTASVEELGAVLAHVRSVSTKPSKPIVLLGYSWGGQVVLEYIRRNHHDGIVHGAIVSNAPLDEPSYAAHQLDIRQGLDESLRQYLEREEEQTDNIAYKTLIGTSESNITGSMRDWSVLSLLLKEKPTDPPKENHNDFPFSHIPLLLLAGGEHDTAPYREYQAVADIHSKNNNKSSNIQAIVLSGADHAPFYGPSKEAYFAAIRQFLLQLV